MQDIANSGNDVVLVYPSTGLDVRGVSIGLPMSVLALAAELVPEFTVRIIDQRLDRKWQQSLAEALNANPLCVGISAMTGHQILHGLHAARIVKEHSDTIPVVWGGMHVTLTPEQSLQHPLVDMLIIGDGEHNLLNLVRAIADKTPLHDVPGLCWQEQDTVRRNPDGPLLNLDDTSPYPYELVDIESYISPSDYFLPGVKRALPFMASRGCPFRCGFCSQPRLTKVYRKMSPDLVHDRTAAMVERFNLDLVIFADDEFFADPVWGTAVANRINGQVKWWVQARATDLSRVDLPNMERCGLHVVCPGLESASPRILEMINKGQTVEDYYEANRRLARTGIHAVYGLMMGFPGETRQEVYETVDFVLALLRENRRACINSFSLFTPLPGTDLTELAVERGFKMPTTLEEWVESTVYNFKTPWIEENLDLYMNLMYTSKFVGPRAKTVWRRLGPFSSPALDVYSRIIKRRWEKRQFGRTWDINLLRYAHRRLVNPALEGITHP